MNNSPIDRPNTNEARTSADGATANPHRATRSPLRGRAAALLVALPPLTVLLLLPRLAQDPAYHAFADTRAWHGLPNALDVLTNLPFLLAGMFGLRATLRQPATPLRAAWLAFFGGVTFVALGSGWYHLTPTDASLVWDRLPMTLAFTSLFAAMLGETVSPQLGRLALFPALLAGVVTVFSWQRTGDLRPYFAVQALTLAGVPTLLALFPRRGEGRNWLVAGLGGYALAFAAEQSDHAVFAFTRGTLSGHSLKHCFAALACIAVAAMLHGRRHTLAVSPTESA
jgi:hypothetical protein